MRFGLAIVLGASLTALAVPAAWADVNCKQVKKYLGTGRTAQDVADTVVISIEDVKKCQAGGDAAGKSAAPSAAAPAPGAA